MTDLTKEMLPQVPQGGETKAGASGEDELGAYFREIRQYPRLTPEEERELAQGCAAGDQAAIRRMVQCNLRLVVAVAKEYAGRGVPLMDLIQEGNIGLIVAAQKFDYSRELRFSTYATKWIRQGISRCLMNHAGLIRVPVHTAERMRAILAARAAWIQANGQEPDLEQLAGTVGLPPEKVAKLLSLVPEISSLDAPRWDGGPAPAGPGSQGTPGYLGASPAFAGDYEPDGPTHPAAAADSQNALRLGRRRLSLSGGHRGAIGNFQGAGSAGGEAGL